jgi:two-component system, OmpR family, response regulator
MGKPVIRCLLVDDDDEIRASVAEYLGRFSMEVRPAADGREMRRLVAAEGFDVVVLDIMLPDETGIALCQWLQGERPDLPVIMLTAQGDPVSRVVGLEMGADDYIGKPFEPRELVARIHAVLRRTRRSKAGGAGAARGDEVRFAGWTLDRVMRQLVSPDRVVVALSSAEFRLLSAFVERPGRLLTRERLLELTRAPGVEVNDRSIDLAVSRLRQKLGDSPREPRLIRTVRGEGYLFDLDRSS